MATIVTNAGKGVITARFLAGAPALSLFVGWGTGDAAAAAADTALSAEAAEARAPAAVTQATTATADDTIQAIGTLTATGARSITNAGLFDAAASGNLIMKGDFAALPLNSGDSIAFTMKIQLT
jgi:hypothetical protein